MPNKAFFKHLSRKLKTGNMRSIHLNAIPGIYGTRLDLASLNTIDLGLPDIFLEYLLQKPKFKFIVSLDKELIRDTELENQKELNIITKKLNTIYYQNMDNYLEFGIKTFGIGYPLLIKRDKQDPTKIIKAPLIIWNLDIEKSIHKSNEWIFYRDDDYPVKLNEVLLSHIEQDEGIIFSDLAEKYFNNGLINEKAIINLSKEILGILNVSLKFPQSLNIDKTPDKKHLESLTKTTTWINWSGVFGLYKTQKESIVNELNEVINNFDDFKFENHYSNSFQKTTTSGVETDPSQESIINSLTNYNSRIIQGPPGTGKSQSLTSIITNSLENGGKCLVVCEKKTALDVIYKNLDDLGYGKICALIDDVSKDRKKIIDKARASIERVNKVQKKLFRNNDYERDLALYSRLKHRINKSHKSVLKKIFGDDDWKELIGKFLSSDRIQSKNILKSKLNEKDYQFNYDEFNKLKQIIIDGQFLFNKIGINQTLDEFNNSIFEGPFFNRKKIEIEEYLESQKNNAKNILSRFEINNNKHGLIFLKNDVFNNLKIKILSYFSNRFKKIKAERNNIKGRYKDLIISYSKQKYFEHNFPDYSKVNNIELIQRNILSYLTITSNLLKELPNFKQYFEWKSYFLSLPEFQQQLLSVLVETKINEWDKAFESWYFDKVLSKYESELGPFLQDSRLSDQLSELRESLKQSQYLKILDYWSNKLKFSIDNFIQTKGNINSLYNYKKNKQYGRKNSLRKIIGSDFNLFTDFFPVVLVNPIVSSSIFPLREGLFDIVIFDESSQLRLEDTYTSFLKGKFKFISGDTHQMPPSNYFGPEIVLDIGEDIEDNEYIKDEPIDDSLQMADKDSLLQFGEDSGFYKSYLDFHYRSQHPFLIDFSNAAFYGSRLSPMPANRNYKPIRFIEVNGIYNKNGTNPEEAKRVLDILFQDIAEDKHGVFPSIGVATFNIDQRNLILEMIQEECSVNKDKSLKYKKMLGNGFFVKNLENIQGDERDIIIISTTFGLNEERNFRQSFGPINQLKGYKLLNVIITRAKHKLYLCTSIPKTYYANYRNEIEKAGGNVGKGIFYAYLVYAKAIEEDDHIGRKIIIELLKKYCTENSLDNFDEKTQSVFGQEIYNFVASYVGKNSVKINYQIAGFRLDFVILSKPNNKPIAAIECDGASFHQSEEAYLYDIYRNNLIEKKMGLKLYRIWSTNWWMSKKSEEEKLINFINALENIEIFGGGRFNKNVINNQLYQNFLNNNKQDKLKTIDEIRKDGESDFIYNNLEVIIKNINEDKLITIHFTDEMNKENLASSDKKIIYKDSEIAKAILNRTIGEMFKINGVKTFFEIVQIVKNPPVK